MVVAAQRPGGGKAHVRSVRLPNAPDRVRGCKAGVSMGPSVVWRYRAQVLPWQHGGLCGLEDGVSGVPEPLDGTGSPVG